VDDLTGNLKIYLKWKDSMCKCPQCSSEATLRKAEPRKEGVRHLNCFEHKTLLFFDAQEMECKSCGRMFNRVPAFMGHAVFMTEPVVEDMVEKARGTSVKQVGEWYEQPDSTVHDIYYQVLGERDEKRVLVPVKHLGIDEISLTKGHGNFVLLLYDLSRHEVIDVLPDRKKETLEEYLRSHRNTVFANLEAVCMDMWKPYKLAVTAVFPGVNIVVDKFHIFQHLHDCLLERTQVLSRGAKSEEEKASWKKDWRVMVLRSKEKQLDRPHGARELQDVLSRDRELRRLHALREEFRELYQLSRPPVLRKRLENWLRRARYLGSRFLKDFIHTVRNWKNEILNFGPYRITNGVSEGFNCKVKLVKRMAYGFRNFVDFRLRILHTCGNSLCHNGLH